MINYYSKYYQIVRSIDYIISHNEKEIKKRKLFIDWSVIARKLNIDKREIKEIGLLFELFYHFLRPIFARTWDFQKLSDILDEIKSSNQIIQYKEIQDFILYILAKNNHKRNSFGIEIQGNKIVKKLHISEQESRDIFEIFILFYNFYKFFFHQFKPKQQLQPTSVLINKQSIDSLSDYAYLFGNIPITLKYFKSHFSQLHKLLKQNPSLFEITGSTIKISDHGIKFSEKFRKYKIIGRKPPNVLKIGDNKYKIQKNTH